MKRILLMLVCLTLLVGVYVGCAEEMKDFYGMYQAAKEAGDEGMMAQVRLDMPNRLFPAMDSETGLWGYVNFLGEWVIPAQYAYARSFRGDYAAVTVPADDPEDWYHDGIIDRQGRWALEPLYTVDEGYDGWTYGGLNRGMYLIWSRKLLTEDQEENGLLFGYFDVPSGFFSGLRYGTETRFWNASRLVPAYLDGQPCYIDRYTGEPAILLLEDTELETAYDVNEFRDGWAVLANREDKRFLINEQGDMIFPGEHLAFSCYDNAFGRVLMLETTTVQDKFVTVTTSLYGYYDPAAQDWLLEPQFEEAFPFSGDGYACVKLAEGNYGHIDVSGRVLADGFSESYKFLREYAYLPEANVLINAAGEMVCVLPEGFELMEQWDDELDEARDYYVSPGGLMELRRKEDHRICLMNLNGDWILPPDGSLGAYSPWEGSGEGHRFFSCGLYPVQMLSQAVQVGTAYSGGVTQPILEGAVGYINARGELVIDCVYDDGGVFLNGLAYVVKDGQAGYIDAFGHSVFFWQLGEP